MENIKAFILTAVSVGVMLAFSSCKEKVEEPVTVTVSPSTLSLIIGQTSKLQVTLTGSKEPAEITWYSSNKSVASVSDGIVNAKGVGKAVIRASVGEAKSECTVTVTQSEIEDNTTFANSDYWAFTDALGRKARQTGKKKNSKKYVAMFYWTWHQQLNDFSEPPRNITEILREYPEAIKQYDHPAWGSNKPGTFYWEQPIYGYYRTTDKWVLRKQAELLADAGIDVVFFDCTNGAQVWDDSMEALMETWSQALKDGVNVPKISCLLPFGASDASLTSLRHLYNDLYKLGRYQELWFYWKNKPMLMAYPDNLTSSKTDSEIKSFFTFRPGQPDYVNGPSSNRNDQWGWLEVAPYQHLYVGNEEMPVGVAQNACPASGGHCSAFNLENSYGRSRSYKRGFDSREDGYLYGWNFQEQWDNAIKADPQLVFVTGWNEYIAGMWLPKDGWTGDPFSFVDEFDWDHSRDIEPNAGWGEYGDVYYQQLIDNVRTFKGMDVQPEASAKKTIELGNEDAWKDVEPYYMAYKGNTFTRAAKGHRSTYYTNNTGRNDLCGARVARDDDKIYFYVETADFLSPSTGKNWMMLFIDIDRDKETGWNGFDFVVNHVSPADGKVTVEKCVDNTWKWEKCATGDCVIGLKTLEIALSRADLNLTGNLDFEFKWSDNMKNEGDVMDFYVNGDTAPGARFNYVYTAED